jgi:hypothetical protein
MQSVSPSDVGKQSTRARAPDVCVRACRNATLGQSIESTGQQAGAAPGGVSYATLSHWHRNSNYTEVDTRILNVAVTTAAAADDAVDAAVALRRLSLELRLVKPLHG